MPISNGKSFLIKYGSRCDSAASRSLVVDMADWHERNRWVPNLRRRFRDAAFRPFAARMPGGMRAAEPNFTVNTFATEHAVGQSNCGRGLGLCRDHPGRGWGNWRAGIR